MAAREWESWAPRGRVPNLEREFYATIARLDAKPVTIEPVSSLDGARHRVLLDGSSFPPLLRPSLRTQVYGRLAVCKAIGVPRLPAADKASVRSAIPTLLLQGEYDPVTPPSNGVSAARTLTHAHLVFFPGIGHGARFTGYCPNQIVLSFFDSPNANPNDACIATMHDPF